MRRRGITLVEASIVASLVLVASVFVATRFTGTDTATSDRAAQATLVAVDSAEVQNYVLDGSFTATTVCSGAIPGFTCVDSSVGSTSAQEASILSADAGQTYVIAVRGGLDSCWIRARAMAGTTSGISVQQRRTVVAVDVETTVCSADLASTATLSGATGISIDAPATATID